jgi:acyl-CoA synthetase (AMP-forming)/AMP-acid ligase II
LPANVQGMVVIRSNISNIQNRYLGDDVEIKTDSEGCIVTGDIGFIDEEGFLFITGREKDLIIIGGINISPIEIENVLMELTEIEAAAVFGISERIFGEKIVAFVVPDHNVDLDMEKIYDHCQRRLTKIKVPKQIDIINSLPKTERGKLDKKIMNKIWLDMNG